MTAEMRASLQAEAREAGVLPLDKMHILIDSPQPSFDGDKRVQITGNTDMKKCVTGSKLCDRKAGKGALLGKVTIQQGQMVVLIGPPGEGKSTLLKLMASAILPTPGEGTVFVPSHLRVVHVSTEALFYQGTLKENLTMGVVPGTKDGEPERVNYICELLGVSEDILTEINSQETKPWALVLSQSQRHLLHLARVLIANPEVICVHKPTLFFDEKVTTQVMKCLNEYVLNKGLGLDAATWNTRRPRTVVMTSSKIYSVESSGMIIHVSCNHGLREVRHEEVTRGMIG